VNAVLAKIERSMERAIETLSSDADCADFAGILAKLEVKMQMKIDVLTRAKREDSRLAMEHDPCEMLSVQTIAKLTGLTEQFLYEQIRTGKLPYVKKGKYRLVLRSDLVEWIERDRKNRLAFGLGVTYSNKCNDRRRVEEDQEGVKADAGTDGRIGGDHSQFDSASGARRDGNPGARRDAGPTDREAGA